MEKMMQKNEEAIVKKRTEVEELEKEHQELRTRLAELQLEAEAKHSRDLKTALESIDDIRRDLTEIRQNNGTTEEQILNISSKLEKTEKSLEEQRKLNEKLSERLEWLEDKITVEEYALLFYESIQILMVRGDTKELLIFDRETSQWKTSAVELPEAVYSCGMICLEQEIYIFGGGSLWDRTFKLNKEMKWDRMADMNEGRGCISNNCLLFDGCIWVFGGENQSEEDLNTVEKYIPSENKWIKMPTMDQKRKCAAAAVSGGKIYVCGGNFGTGDSLTALKSVECFDPKEEVWTKFVDLPSPTWGMGVISDGGCLIIIGGSRGCNKHVRKINPSDADPTWKELPSMKEERYFLTVQSIGKKIFAIGGVDRKSLEIFDGKSWQSGPELPEICWAVSSVVIPHSLAAELLPK